MKHAVQKGNKEFQQSLSKQAEGIRQAKSYNGPSDPLHGDAPYVKVREAAGELMEILFDTDQERTSYDQGRNSPMFMQGFGSTGSNSQSNMGYPVTLCVHIYTALDFKNVKSSGAMASTLF
eukprot:gene8804-9745_t